MKPTPAAIVLILSLMAFGGCDRKPSTPPPPTTGAAFQAAVASAAAVGRAS